jgi:CRISPR-associated protein Csd1
MILQSLKDYYDRKAADPDSGIAPIGWEKKEIPFIIVIDRDGNIVQIEDTRENEGKNMRARSFIVPQGVKKTSGIAANLLWDVAVMFSE